MASTGPCYRPGAESSATGGDPGALREPARGEPARGRTGDAAEPAGGSTSTSPVSTASASRRASWTTLRGRNDRCRADRWRRCAICVDRLRCPRRHGAGPTERSGTSHARASDRWQGRSWRWAYVTLAMLGMAILGGSSLELRVRCRNHASATGGCRPWVYAFAAAIGRCYTS